MKRKWMVLAAPLLAALWSQAGLAKCYTDSISEAFTATNVVLNQHTAGESIGNQHRSAYFSVTCDSEGGWFELALETPLTPTSVGNGVVETNIGFLGFSITADLRNENDDGETRTVLTDGSFTSRRWTVPPFEGSPKTFNILSNPVFEFWAIGPEDPKSGILNARTFFTLTTEDGHKDLVYGFDGTAKVIASCYINSSALYFSMPDTNTTDLKQTGILEASKQEESTSGGIDCDRDVNVQFTLSATDTVAGLPNVLAPETGGAEGVGVTFKYRFLGATDGESSEPRDLTLGAPFNLLDGPVGQVRRTYFYLAAYYYRFGNKVSAGHFRSTAVLNIQIQ